MVSDTIVIVNIIVTAGLTAWNGYLQMKIKSICNNCKFDYTPRKVTA